MNKETLHEMLLTALANTRPERKKPVTKVDLLKRIEELEAEVSRLEKTITRLKINGGKDEPLPLKCEEQTWGGYPLTRGDDG